MTHITVYSDYVCPYCYMGYASLQQVAAEQPLDIEWRAYELRAGGEEPPPAYKARIEEHWPQTRRMAEEYGLDLRALRFGIDSRPAHQAYKIVQGLAPEQAAAFHEALFAGHWPAIIRSANMMIWSPSRNRSGLMGRHCASGFRLRSAGKRCAPKRNWRSSRGSVASPLSSSTTNIWSAEPVRPTNCAPSLSGCGNWRRKEDERSACRKLIAGPRPA